MKVGLILGYLSILGERHSFIVVDLDENNNILSVQVVPNIGEHFGGMSKPADNILRLRPNTIITHGIGPRALNAFQSAGIAVLRANANTVREVIEAYKQDALEELTEGCHHARHKMSGCEKSL